MHPNIPTTLLYSSQKNSIPNVLLCVGEKYPNDVLLPPGFCSMEPMHSSLSHKAMVFSALISAHKGTGSSALVQNSSQNKKWQVRRLLVRCRSHDNTNMAAVVRPDYIHATHSVLINVSTYCINGWAVGAEWNAERHGHSMRFQMQPVRNTLIHTEDLLAKLVSCLLRNGDIWHKKKSLSYSYVNRHC